jgi:hypothetical protein
MSTPLSLEVLGVGEGEITPKDGDKYVLVPKAPRHEDIWRNGGVAPRIYLGTRWTCVPVALASDIEPATDRRLVCPHNLR